VISTTMPEKVRSSRRDSLTIGELARTTGVNIETIRYYERIEIFPSPDRTSTGRRLYREAHLTLLCFIKRSRDLGFTLKDIQTLLTLRGQSKNCPAAAQILERHLVETRVKLRDLTRVEKILASALQGCGTEPSDCTFLKMVELGTDDEGSFSSCCGLSAASGC
jgi:MerR family transcriptional regulator, mercuric resistance operon regulatory protein